VTFAPRIPVVLYSAHVQIRARPPRCGLVSRRLRRSSGRASNRACVSSFFCKLMDARVKLHMERTVLFVHICVPPQTCGTCRGAVVLGASQVSPAHARTHTHLAFFLRTGASHPAVSTRHCIRACNSPAPLRILSLCTAAAPKTGTPHELCESERWATLVAAR